MGHRYQKGAKRPDPHAHRDRGRTPAPYRPSGDVPWPELGDGTPWTGQLHQVTHPDVTDETGDLARVDWEDGAWWAIVHWPGDGLMREPVRARMRLANLLPAKELRTAQ